MHCGHDHSAPVRDPIFGGSSYEASMLRGLLGTILGEGYVAQHGLDKAIDAAQACLSRAEAPAIEPVAWIDEFGNVFPLAAWVKSEVKAKWRPLYTHPAPDQEAAELLELNRTLADINANLMARLADQEARPAQEAAEPVALTDQRALHLAREHVSPYLAGLHPQWFIAFARAVESECWNAALSTQASEAPPPATDKTSEA